MQHVVAKTTYYWVIFWLFVLLVLTVLVAEFEAGSWNLPIALTIAFLKTLLIVTFFMHLKFSSPLVRMFAAAGFVWLLIMLVFIAADVTTRGWTG